jgi:2-oxoglutarate ferredoxin oxidoreductase subunit gamma
VSAAPGVSRVRLTGFGGQGVVLAAAILGRAAAIHEGREATLIQAYGPEARGGATSADVTISDERVLFPIIEEADILVCMSLEGFTKFSPSLRPGGTLLYEEQLVRLPAGYAAGRVCGIAATRLAEEAGRKLVANIVMLGFLAGATGVVGREALEEAVRSSVPRGTEELNLGAFARGFAHGASCAPAPSA